MSIFGAVDRRILRLSRNFVPVCVSIILAGFALLFLSMIIGVDRVSFTGALRQGTVPGATGAKEVGYFFAPNWSLFTIVVFPVIVGFCFKMRGDMDQTLRDLADGGMVRGRDFAPIPADRLIERWHADRRAYAFLLLAAPTLSLAFVVWNWAVTVAAPVLHGFPTPIPPIDHNTYSYDWSVASQFQGSGVGRLPELAFGALAYLAVPAPAAFLALFVMIDAVFFVFFTAGMLRSEAAQGQDGAPLPQDWMLVAAPGDEDDRLCGFKVFSPFFSSMYCAAVAILVGLLLAMIQNAYLRTAAAPDIAAFLGGDWTAAAGALGKAVTGLDPLAALAVLFQGPFGDFVHNILSEVAVFMVLFVVGFCVVACWTVLYKSAQRARDQALAHLPQLAAELQAEAPALKTRLERMRFWPLAWLSLTAASVIMGFLLLSVFSYRLLLLPVVGAAAIVTARVVAFFARQLGSTDRAAGADA